MIHGMGYCTAMARKESEYFDRLNLALGKQDGDILAGMQYLFSSNQDRSRSDIHKSLLRKALYEVCPPEIRMKMQNALKPKSMF